MRILKFPDPGLRVAAAPVTAFDDDLRNLAADLAACMHAAPGIGITAPHVGLSRRLVAIDLSDAAGLRFFANPEIVWTSPETAKHLEGSVSMPGVTDEIERPVRVRVRYQDLSGAEATEEADGLLSVCLQHEIDQLNGIFWLQRLSRLKRDRLIRRYEKLQRAS